MHQVNVPRKGLGVLRCPNVGCQKQVDVSVITVVYNGCATLQRCIDSVITQKDVSIEYILIDGGSIDGTLDVIHSNLDSFDYAISEPDNGIYDAMNKGLAVAHGDFISFINSDDWLEPNGLSLSLTAINKHSAEASIGFANIWDKHGKFSHVWRVGNFDARILTSGMSFCHQALVASRLAYNIVGPFDSQIAISADYKWIKQLYLSDLKTVVTETPVVNFSFNGVAANNRAKWKSECKALLKQQFPFLDASDISGFLEYVYKDAALDPHTINNLIVASESSALLLQSFSLFLLERLTLSEALKGNVVSTNNRVALKPPRQGKLAVESPRADTAPVSISVVIPVYNVQEYVETCLQSVLHQSFRNIEVICVNDGSTDNSLHIVQTLAVKDSRIRIINKANGGLSSARNAGWRAAIGEYIHFLDSDDYIQPDMYETLYSFAKKEDLDIVKSNLGFIDHVYPTKRPPLPNQTVFTFEQFATYAEFVSPCSGLYSQRLLNCVHPFLEGVTYEDRPFNWETLLRAKRIGHVDQTFYMYRAGRPGSIMTQRRSNMRHYDAFVALDRIRQLLHDNNITRKYERQYAIELLRVFSMLIDINAIPRATYGHFYWSIRSRLRPLAVSQDQIQQTTLPHKAKALYAFFGRDGAAESERFSGEHYFFRGPAYASMSSSAYAGSSCELFLIAEKAVERLFKPLPTTDETAFCKAVMLGSLFDEIHNGTSINSVHDLDVILRKLRRLLFNDEFKELSSALHAACPTSTPRLVDHLCFQAHEAVNYQACRTFLSSYFAARGLKYCILTMGDITTVRGPEPLTALEGTIVSALRSISIRPYAFSQICAMKRYINRFLDLTCIQTLTVLWPTSPPELYLITLLKSSTKIVFLPHGLPQISSCTFGPDAVLKLTHHTLWDELFPAAKCIHAGWPEATTLLSTASKRVTNNKTVVFLSQIEGGRVHKLEDFIVVANAFLDAALTIPSHHCSFNIRLRNSSELASLDRNLVEECSTRANITFTTSSDCSLTDVQCSLLVTATSTGLLYAQHLKVPCLQVVTTRLLQHWPFLFVDKQAMVFCDLTSEDLPSAILRALENTPCTDMYDELEDNLRFLRLDEIYGREPSHKRLDRSPSTVASSARASRDTSLSHANTLFRRGHFEEALAIYQRLAETYPLELYTHNVDITKAKLARRKLAQHV